MPITVTHGPDAGALGAVAVRAGQLRASQREQERRAKIAALLQDQSVKRAQLSVNFISQQTATAARAGSAGSAAAASTQRSQQQAESQTRIAEIRAASELEREQLRNDSALQKEQLKAEKDLIKADLDARSKMELEQFKIQGAAEMEQQRASTRAEAMNAKVEKRLKNFDDQKLANADAFAKGLIRKGEFDQINFKLAAAERDFNLSISDPDDDQGGSGLDISGTAQLGLVESIRQKFEFPGGDDADRPEFVAYRNASEDERDQIVMDKARRRLEQIQNLQGGGAPENVIEAQDQFSGTDFSSLPGPISILGDLRQGPVQEEIAAPQGSPGVAAQLGLSPDALTRSLPSVATQLGDTDPEAEAAALLQAIEEETDPARLQELLQQAQALLGG